MEATWFSSLTSTGRFPVCKPENLVKYEERHLVHYSHNCTNAQLYISNTLIYHSIRRYTWAVPMRIWGSEHRIRPSLSWSDFCHQWKGLCSGRQTQKMAGARCSQACWSASDAVCRRHWPINSGTEVASSHILINNWTEGDNQFRR